MDLLTTATRISDGKVIEALRARKIALLVVLTLVLGPTALCLSMLAFMPMP